MIKTTLFFKLKSLLVILGLLFFGLFTSNTVSAQVVDSIIISSPTSYQVFQRDSNNQADISITGTYTGTPTAIEASWNGGAYTTIVASPSGGTFSGTLEDQTGGQATLTVRFTNDTTISASKTYVGVGDIFVIIGQSNASGRATNHQIYSHATLKATLFGNDDNWKELVDFIDNDTNQVDAVSSDNCPSCGSLWPLVATHYLADQGVPIAYITAANGGSSIAQWQPNSANHGDATTLYGSMYRRINAAGGRVKAVLFWQGETDALNGTGQAVYKSLLVSMADNIYSDFGVKTIVTQLGPSTLLSATNLNNIRLAQQSAWNDNGSVFPGPSLYDIYIADPLHFRSDSVNQIAANRWWVAIKALIDGSDGRGPILSSAEHNLEKTQIKLTFTDSSLPLLPQSNFSGFSVKKDGALVSISSISRITDNQLLLNLDTQATGTLTVSLGTGNTGEGATVPTDSSTYNLPADIFVDYTVTAESQSSSSSSSTSSSSPSNVCTDASPGAEPQSLYSAVPQGTDSIMLSFTEAADPIDHYALQFGTASNNYTYGQEDIGKKGIKTYLVQSLSPNTTYYFRIRGGNGCATGPWSNEISAKTKPIISFNQLEVTDPQLITTPTTTTVSTNTTNTTRTSLVSPVVEESVKEESTSQEEINPQGGYEVKIKVVDTNKKPVAGAKVEIHSKVQEAFTNSDGVAYFNEVEPGNHKVLIAYNNYKGEQYLNLAGEVEEFNLTVTVKPENVLLSPQLIWIVGIVILATAAVCFLVFLITKRLPRFSVAT